MICAACGKEIDYLVISVFERDGTDSQVEVAFERHPENAVVFETTPNWTGYELSAEERVEDIKCPHCGKFPFHNKEVQLYDIVRVVLFADKANRDPDALGKPAHGLVSREALIQYFATELLTNDFYELIGFLKTSEADLSDIVERIREFPEADAVEVVRCKDCLYRSQYSNDDGLFGCGAHDGGLFEPDHYCAYGERRT